MVNPEILSIAMDFNMRLLWEMKGPKDTRIATISCYLCTGSLLIFTSFEEGTKPAGWDVYSPLVPTRDRLETLKALAPLCAVEIDVNGKVVKLK